MSLQLLEEGLATPKGLLVSSHLSLSSITPFSSTSHLPHRLPQSLLHLFPPHCSLEKEKEKSSTKTAEVRKKSAFLHRIK